MVWNNRIALILLECMMLGCSYGCMRNQRKSQIYRKNIAIKKVTIMKMKYKKTEEDAKMKEIEFKNAYIVHYKNSIYNLQKGKW